MRPAAMPPLRAFILAAALLGPAPGPGRAEENRLLPFWGQPFPSGFTRREVGIPSPPLPCPGAVRWRYRGEPRRWGDCPVVLHARS